MTEYSDLAASRLAETLLREQEAHAALTSVATSLEQIAGSLAIIARGFAVIGRNLDPPK
jgi:hypothetical protein